MSIEKDVIIEVYPSNGYYYRVHMGEELNLMYKEQDNPSVESRISFGAIEEAEEVANAILMAVEMHRKLNK